ncbi:MAG: hypothetical protein Q7R63_00965 [bacterium]|nr:hypothetical protein [bacterium]
MKKEISLRGAFAVVVVFATLASSALAQTQPMGGMGGGMQQGGQNSGQQGMPMPPTGQSRMVQGQTMGQGDMMGGGMGGGMGNGMGGGMGMMGGHEDPMLTALTDIKFLVDGLLPSICSTAGQACFDNLKTAVKRGSKTYSKLVKDLTALEDEGEIGSMQMVINFARMVPSFDIFNRLLSAADAMDAGDTEDALNALQSIVVKKGPFATMIKGIIMQLQSMSEELAYQEEQFTEDAEQRTADRAERKAQEVERRTAEKTMRDAMTVQGGPMGQQGTQEGQGDSNQYGPTGTDSGGRNSAGMYPGGPQGGSQGQGMNTMQGDMGGPMGRQGMQGRGQMNQGNMMSGRSNGMGGSGMMGQGMMSPQQGGMGMDQMRNQAAAGGMPFNEDMARNAMNGQSQMPSMNNGGQNMMPPQNMQGSGSMPPPMQDQGAPMPMMQPPAGGGTPPVGPASVLSTIGWLLGGLFGRR